jgi:hypothetical protein
MGWPSCLADPGRRVLPPCPQCLIFPTHVEGIRSDKAVRADFTVHVHIFYASRVEDVHDGITKFAGMNDASAELDDEGNERRSEKVVKKEKEEADARKKEEEEEGADKRKKDADSEGEQAEAKKGKADK